MILRLKDWVEFVLTERTDITDITDRTEKNKKQAATGYIQNAGIPLASKFRGFG